jgi:Kef-type K+ transport system membrane component KefB
LFNFPAFVGAFLVGLALNTGAQNKPATEKLWFFANSYSFRPSFS